MPRNLARNAASGKREITATHDPAARRKFPFGFGRQTVPVGVSVPRYRAVRPGSAYRVRGRKTRPAAPRVRELYRIPPAYPFHGKVPPVHARYWVSILVSPP